MADQAVQIGVDHPDVVTEGQNPLWRCLGHTMSVDQRLATALIVIGECSSRDTALHAVADLQRRGRQVSLLLVGDGLGRPHVERLAKDLEVNDVRFTGAVPYEEIPRYVAAMDVALTLARPDEVFHYSPVKLREYMACGRPVVANPVGEIGRMMTHGQDALV